MKQIKRMERWCVRSLCAALLVLMVLPAHADMGPKPSVVVDFQNAPEEPYYATLLSDRCSTGPYSSMWREDEEGRRVQQPVSGRYYNPGEEGYEIWKAFSAYEESDPEELYFLQYIQECSAEDRFRWGYYPPDTFKLLLYFPESDGFLVGDSMLSRYAFDSYFTVDLAGLEPPAGGVAAGLTAVESYDYTWEMISLAVRVALTIALELAIAWRFGFRSGKQLRFILLVNVVTQLGLNVGLNLRAYYNGTLFILLPYLMMEAGVTLTEWLLYRQTLPRLAEEGHTGSKRRVLGYALAANGISLVLGWVLAHVVPGIF